MNMMRPQINNVANALFDTEFNPHEVTVPFMPYSNCNASDFFHPWYKKICSKIAQHPCTHRKQWEFVYIIYQLYKSGILVPGAKGLGFGVGTEPLACFFASLGSEITATDAPEEIANRDGWNNSQHPQFTNCLEKIYNPDLLSREKFEQQVRFQHCDMNHIDVQLKEFDFCWSSCCFEHLGSLQAGLDFVINSVEKTLRVGGIACHTTEYNLSSNDDTLESNVLSIYRKQDIEYLIQRLRERGHIVCDLLIAPALNPLDSHVDLPPYKQKIHIRLKLADYVCTSLGILIQRGI
jgi:hypothetical protein